MENERLPVDIISFYDKPEHIKFIQDNNMNIKVILKKSAGEKP